MNTNNLNQWLTLGANIGVLIGIILLVVELNQNREMIRSQTRHQIAQSIIDIQTADAANPQLMDVLVRAESGEELTTAEDWQYKARTTLPLCDR